MSEGNLSSRFKNIITSSPYTIYQTGLLAMLVSGDVKYGFFTLLAIVMGDGFVFVEKSISKKIMGENSKKGNRPSGCGNRKEKNCSGCGIYSEKDSFSSTYGMPSGHAQITSFAASYWTVYVWMKYISEKNISKKKKLKDYAIISTIIMWSLVMVVCGQRIYSKCHSFLQIIVGLLFGTIFGILGYFISTLLFKDLPKISLDF